MLCKYCAGFSIKLIREGDYIHQPSPSALYASAKEGCIGCDMIQNACTATTSDSDVGTGTHVWFEKDERIEWPKHVLAVRCNNKRGHLHLATDDGLLQGSLTKAPFIDSRQIIQHLDM